MNIQGFKVFCDLVETGSFSQAAEMNRITQSAVSQQIRAMEKRFGATLIERGKKNFSVTPEGRIFLKASHEILNLFDDLGHRIHEMQNVIAGTLRIASVYSIGLHELPHYLRAFRRLYPSVDVHVEYRRSAQVYSDVLAGVVDFGLVAFPSRRRGLVVESFWQDKLVLICPPDHPLAGRRRVRFRDLEGQRFVSFEPDQPTARAIDRKFQHAGVHLRHALEYDNIETVKRAVQIENGLSIVPLTTVVDELELGRLRAAELDEPDMFRPLGLVQKRSRAASPAQKRFIEMLKEDPEGFARGAQALEKAERLAKKGPKR